MKDMNNLQKRFFLIFQHCVIKSAFEVLGERDFSRFIWHVNNPLATQERKSKVFSQPKSRKIQGDLTIISTSELRAENFEWVVLPLFFLTLFGSHRYTFLGPLTPHYRGEASRNVSPFIFSFAAEQGLVKSSLAAALVQKLKQRSIPASSDFSTTIIPLKKSSPLSCAKTSTSQMFTVVAPNHASTQWWKIKEKVSFYSNTKEASYSDLRS